MRELQQKDEAAAKPKKVDYTAREAAPAASEDRSQVRRALDAGVHRETKATANAPKAAH